VKTPEIRPTQILIQNGSAIAFAAFAAAVAWALQIGHF
jgi:hypothetical protein